MTDLLETTLQNCKNILVKLSPWLKPQRRLIRELAGNYCKLLIHNSNRVEFRTRGNDLTYFRGVAYFGFFKFYKIKYTSKGKPVNLFMHCICNALCENDSDDLKTVKTCLVKGFCLTQKQALNRLKEVMLKTPEADWFEACEESEACDTLKAVIEFIKTGKCYWTYAEDYIKENKITKKQLEKKYRKSLLHVVSLLHYRVVDQDRYVNEINKLFMLCQEDKSKENDAEIAYAAKKLYDEMLKRGYPKFK